MSRPISAAYLERKLRAISGVQGDNPLPDLVNLSGLLVLENDRPEWRLAAGDRLMSWTVIQPGSVGELSYVGIRNPLNSGVLAVVDQVRAGLGTAGGATGITRANVNFADGSGVFAVVDNVAQGVQMDFRIDSVVAGLPRGATQIFFGTQAAPLTGWFSLDHDLAGGSNLVGKNDEFTRAYVIPPGVQLGYFAIATNTEIHPILTGYERPIEGRFEIK